MFDLLSLATLNESEIKASDIIVFTKYTLIHLYLDNELAGKRASKYLITHYNHVMDQSSIYKNHNDLNDLLCHESG